MARKFQIIDSIENAKNKLGYRDVDQINRTKMAAAKIQEEQEAKNVLNDVETQTAIRKIENEEKLLKAKSKQSETKLNNMNLKIKEANQNRMIKFNDQISKNKEKEIPNYTKKAKNYRILSMFASIISALTSCLGIYYDRYGADSTEQPDNIMMSSFVAMIIISVILNIVLSNLAVINKKFINRKQTLDKILQTLMYTVITFCMGYSIFTNYVFWSSVNPNIVSALMYATIFDISSIVLCLMVYKYDCLEFKEEYLNEINLTGNKNEDFDGRYYRGNLAEENEKRNDADRLKEVTEKTKKIREALGEDESQNVLEIVEKKPLQKV